MISCLLADHTQSEASLPQWTYQDTWLYLYYSLVTIFKLGILSYLFFNFLDVTLIPSQNMICDTNQILKKYLFKQLLNRELNIAEKGYFSLMKIPIIYPKSNSRIIPESYACCGEETRLLRLEEGFNTFVVPRKSPLGEGLSISRITATSLTRILERTWSGIVIADLIVSHVSDALLTRVFWTQPRGISKEKQFRLCFSFQLENKVKNGKQIETKIELI